MKNKYVMLVILALGFILSRLPIIFTSMYKLYDGDELYIGTIAQEIIRGRTLPLFDYPLEPTMGGTLVSGLLAVPFFAVFGPTYLSLKLLALCFGAAILVLIYLFMCKFFNKTAAVITAILFIFSPPLYSILSLMSYGKHYESLVFTAMAMYLFSHIFFRHEQALHDVPQYKLIHFAGLGLVSGFGLFYDYVFSITVLNCLLFWFILDKKFMLRKSFFVFTAFFLIGFSPWIFYAVGHQWANISIDSNNPARPIHELFLANTPAQSLNKLVRLFAHILPASFHFDDVGMVPGMVISNLYELIFVTSLIALCWFNRKGILYRQAFILSYIFLFSLLYSLSFHMIRTGYGDYEYNSFFGFRKLIPLYPFMFMTISLFLSWLWDRRSRAPAMTLFVIIAFFLAASGTAANLKLITPGNIGRPLVYEGFNYETLGDLIAKRYGVDFSRVVALAQMNKEEHRPSIFRGVGFNVGWRYHGDFNKCLKRINAIGPAYRADVLEGIGIFLGYEFKNNYAYITDFAAQLDEQDKPPIYAGLGREIGWRAGDRMDICVQKISQIAYKYRSYCYKGLGEMTGIRFGQNIALCALLAEKIDQEYRCPYFEGLGSNLGWRYLYLLKKDPGHLAEAVPPGCRPQFIRGMRTAGGDRT